MEVRKDRVISQMRVAELSADSKSACPEAAALWTGSRGSSQGVAGPSCGQGPFDEFVLFLVLL